MNLEITGRNYETTKRVRSTVEERSEKFVKYAADLQKIRFTLTQERVDAICEIHLHHANRDFHAKATTEDMLASVDKACATMEKALRRNKTKRADHRGRPDIASVEASLGADEDEIDEDEISKEI